MDSGVDPPYGEREGTAANLGDFLRTLPPPETVEHWSLTPLREKAIKVGAKVVRHGRYGTFQMAGVGEDGSGACKFRIKGLVLGWADPLADRQPPPLGASEHRTQIRNVHHLA